MAQVSIQYVKPEIRNKLQSLLVDCVSRCSQATVAADFIGDLLTDTEKIMISKRIGIALMLLKRVGAREISERLKVSFPTIYRVKTWLSVKGSGYRSLLESILKEDSARQRAHQSALRDTESSPLWFGRTNWKSARKRQWDRVKQTEVPF
jgi:uncharacterized protein YerC